MNKPLIDFFKLPWEDIQKRLSFLVHDDNGAIDNLQFKIRELKQVGVSDVVVNKLDALCKEFLLMNWHIFDSLNLFYPEFQKPYWFSLQVF